MPNEILSALIAALGGLIGGATGAGISLGIERSKHKMERARFLSSMTSVSEVEKARIESYTELWSCLDGISTHRPSEITQNLPKVQEKMQNWYYNRGGGLLITGSAKHNQSTKAAFFAARDLVSSNTSEIWQVFHELRRCLRRDLKIYESNEDEAKVVSEMKAKLRKLEG
jgi:hypothetical protein